MAIISEHPNGLGYIVLYGMTGSLLVKYADAIQSVEEHGLVQSNLQQPTPARALTRAMADRETSQLRARTAFENDRIKVVVLIRETHPVGSEDFDYEKETRAELDKRTLHLKVQGKQKEQIEENFKAHAESLIGDDFRSMTKAVVEDLDGISLRGSIDVRDAGGIYFVPIQHREQLQALTNVLEELHVGYVRAFGVMRGPGEEAQVAIAAEFYIDNEINEIVRLIGSITSRITVAERQRDSLVRLGEVLKRYASLSGRPTSTELKKKLATAIKTAEQKIAELTKKKSDKKKSQQ
jgi:hypothetical protein